MTYLSEIGTFAEAPRPADRETEMALVIYESMFGNTKTIARTIADEIALTMPAAAIEVSLAPDVIGDHVALLVVGAPTHAFGLSRPKTRSDAAKRSAKPTVSGGRGIREWLAEMHREGDIAAATFDTKTKHPRLPGSAAKKAEKQLRKRGFKIIRGATTFYVNGTEGPLVDGEVQRARTWAHELVATTRTR